MSWKIIVGGILIFAGLAQFFKLVGAYKYTYTTSMLVGLGFLFGGMILLGVYLVRQGRIESKNKF